MKATDLYDIQRGLELADSLLIASGNPDPQLYDTLNRAVAALDRLSEWKCDRPNTGCCS